MSGIWDFLTNEKNRAVLGWLGGGVVVVVGGLWTGYTYFDDSEQPQTPPVQVSANRDGVAAGHTAQVTDRGGIAAGGDVTVVGVPPEQFAPVAEPLRREQALTDEQRRTIATLQERLGVGERALATFFRDIGEAEISIGHWEAKLGKIADDYKRALAQAAVAPGDAPAVAALKAEARAALEAGELAEADAVLERILDAQDAEADRHRLAAAETTAQRGDVALARLRYREAAKYFAAAARRLPADHQGNAVEYWYREADALYRQGDEFGDNAALVDAIERYRNLLRYQAREHVPRDWAKSHFELGIALQKLGERERSTARLKDAVAAFRAALEEYTRERVPLRWAMTQNDLGLALHMIGERESGTARLKDAVAAYRAAFEVFEEAGATHFAGVAKGNLERAVALLAERQASTN